MFRRVPTVSTESIDESDRFGMFRCGSGGGVSCCCCCGCLWFRSETLLLLYFFFVGVPETGNGPPWFSPTCPPPPVGLRHSDVVMFGEPVSFSDEDFFFVPKLSDESDRGKRDRNAGVEVIGGWGW